MYVVLAAATLIEKGNIVSVEDLRPMFGQAHTNDVYVVGFYAPSGDFMPHSIYSDGDVASDTVNFLNGGMNTDQVDELIGSIDSLVERIEKGMVVYNEAS